MTYKEELLENGVILVKNTWTKDEINEIKNENNKLDASLTNREIIKDKPIIVFWRHVEGEQKNLYIR